MARNQIAKKVYIAQDGSEQRSADESVSRLEFRFSSGDVRVIDMGALPPHIATAAAWYGVSQKLGDAYAGAESAAVAVEQFDETLDTLMEGQWVTAREGGAPRVSQLALAYAAAKRDAGATITDEQAIEIVKGWDEAKRKAATDIPQINAHLARLRLEAAQKRAADAAAKVAALGDGATSLDNF